MCVDAKGYDWERPAVEADCAVMGEHFPGVDFSGLLAAMSKDDAKPLTADLALVGAMMHTEADSLGMRYVPFSAIDQNTRDIVKLPVMDQVSDWFENSALGTDMWNNASDWCEKEMGARVHFAMNCGCGLVAVSGYKTGTWASWKKRFNNERADLFGRTRVVKRGVDSVGGLDMTAKQLEMWKRIRTCLEVLPAVSFEDRKMAA